MCGLTLILQKLQIKIKNRYQFIISCKYSSNYAMNNSIRLEFWRAVSVEKFKDSTELKKATIQNHGTYKLESFVLW